jgi:hypothetical protein
MLSGEMPPGAHLPGLHSVERLAAAAFVVTSAPLASAVEAGATSQVADWLDASSRATAEKTVAPPLPGFAPAAPTVLAQIATSQLFTEMARVAATGL